jgi:cation:H+ antiporter
VVALTAWPCARGLFNCGALKSLVTWIESTGWAPWWFVAIFLAASFLMIWRLEAMNASGVEGTVLGTLVMPYCSGIGNLIFAFIIGSQGKPGVEVLTNSLVNNITNMTLLIGLPAAIWGMSLTPQSAAGKKKKKNKTEAQERKVNRLSLLLTLTAVVFFTGATWVLGRDGQLDAHEGVVLIGLFLFWQTFHLFEVLKSNARQNKSFTLWTLIDVALLGVGAYAIYVSSDWLVNAISASKSGFFSAKHLGWLTGWLNVVPNALLAFYYARRGNPEVVYTSQVGDGHISIPLCLGIAALYRPIKAPAFFGGAMALLVAAAAIHFLFIALFGRLPRWMGWLLAASYLVFLFFGFDK